MNIQPLSTDIPREKYAVPVTNGHGPARKLARASRTMQQPFRLGHHFCQMCNFGEYKKRSETFSTTSTLHESAGDSAQPQGPSPHPRPGSLRSGKVIGSRPRRSGEARTRVRPDRPASRSRRAPSRAEPNPTRWSRVSHLPWRSGPRRAAAAPAPRTYRWSPISP